MKFVHIADMHFDSPFVNLSPKDTLGDARRLDQRKAFKEVVEYIKENDIPYFFISGDLYDQRYIKQSTIKYINNLFREIPDTKIFISPGNHDPFIKNSYYNTYKWEHNVIIFDSEFEKVELEKVDIYGFGFNDYYCEDCKIDELKIENNNKINILVMHASLDGNSSDYKKYNFITKNTLKEKGFDYIALGHIHKPYFNEEDNQRIIYPGSPISLGFDELGKHGMIAGDIEKTGLKLEFIPLDDKEFIEIDLDVTNIVSKEELIEKINELGVQDDNFVKVNLIGKRNFEIDIYEIYKFIINNRIIKIKNKTIINYNLDKLKSSYTLKGLFASRMLDRLNDENITDEEKEIVGKAIEIGFDILN